MSHTAGASAPTKLTSGAVIRVPPAQGPDQPGELLGVPRGGRWEARAGLCHTHEGTGPPREPTGDLALQVRRGEAHAASQAPRRRTTQCGWGRTPRGRQRRKSVAGNRWPPPGRRPGCEGLGGPRLERRRAPRCGQGGLSTPHSAKSSGPVPSSESL